MVPMEGSILNIHAQYPNKKTELIIQITYAKEFGVDNPVTLTQ